MVDYYAELNIDSSLGVDEINKELSKLENTWKRRELTSPEKATKMLALIIDAREAFKSTAAKSRYDRELAESRQQSKPVDPNQQRKDDIQRWRTDADTYYDRGEYDLAKIAVDRALALVTDSSDDDLYSLAASVYMEVGEYNAALSFINNAIVSNPQNGLHYLVKAGIYGRSASALKFNDRFKSSQYYEEERKALQIGLNVASSTGDTYAKGRLMGALAFSLYFEPDSDKARAEELAKEALALGENLGNAQKVMDAVNVQHRAEEEAARAQKEAEERAAREEQERIAAAENERKRKIYKEAMQLADGSSTNDMQRAVALLESIIDFNDSKRQIQSLKQSIESQIKLQEAQESAAKKKRQAAIKIAATVAVLVCIATVSSFILHTVRGYRCGDDAYWKLRDGVLIISGTGKINDYDRLDTPWWESYNEIKSIVIEEGITEIGDYALCSLHSVTSVSLPSTLEYIGYEGLSCLYKLKEMELPENLKIIEPYAFTGNAVEKITIPASVECLDHSAFRSSDIKYIDVDENNEFYSSIDGVLFNKDQTALIEYPEAQARDYYKIPDSVVTVEYHAFNIESYAWDNFITTIELGAQTDLSQIWIDPNINMMHDYNEEEYFQENMMWWTGVENALSYPGYRNSNSKIERIVVPDENPYYCAVDGILYSRDMSILYWFPCQNENVYYAVPNGVIEIAPFAFYGWNTSCSIQQIELPSTLRKIGGCAFDIYRSDLTSIVIPEGVEYIGFGAFSGQDSLLQSISLPSTLKEVDEGFINNVEQIYYNGTIADWKSKITVYEYGEAKTENRGYVFQYIPLQCIDGIINSPY